MTGMWPAACGFRRWCIVSMVLPSWARQVVFPVGWPGQEQPAAAGVGVPVQVLEPAALGDHLLHYRRGDGQQPGGVGEPALVVVKPLLVAEGLPLDLGQQVRDLWPFGDELPPSGQRGQLPEAVVLAVRAGILPAVRAGHQRLSASANGSNPGIGMTFASGSPVLSPSSRAGGATVRDGLRLSLRIGGGGGGLRAGSDPAVALAHLLLLLMRRSVPRWPRGPGCGRRGPRRARRTGAVPGPGASRTR